MVDNGMYIPLPAMVKLKNRYIWMAQINQPTLMIEGREKLD
jgi:hypothetical protein